MTKTKIFSVMTGMTDATIRRHLFGDVARPAPTPEYTKADLESALQALKSLPQPTQYHIFVITNKDAGAVIRSKEGIEVAFAGGNLAVFDVLEVGAKSRCGLHTIKSVYKEPVSNELPSILSNRRS